MKDTYIDINEASELSGKSIQTIRRAIKSNKLKVRRKKTPQGFNYLISRNSLAGLYKIKIDDKKGRAPSQMTSQTSSQKGRRSKKGSKRKAKTGYVTIDDLDSFNTTLQKMIDQHQKERENFLRLIRTFQDRILVLENQVKLLDAPKKKWYAFWK